MTIILYVVGFDRLYPFNRKQHQPPTCQYERASDDSMVPDQQANRLYTPLSHFPSNGIPWALSMPNGTFNAGPVNNTVNNHNTTTINNNHGDPNTNKTLEGMSQVLKEIRNDQKESIKVQTETHSMTKDLHIASAAKPKESTDI